jgi:hypothetical protein
MPVRNPRAGLALVVEAQPGCGAMMNAPGFQNVPARIAQ